ncbi:MAG: aspartate kinase [Myxococcota bacterium]
MLLSTGERVSVSPIRHRAVRARAAGSVLPRLLIGHHHHARHNRARIVEVRPFRLHDELDEARSSSSPATRACRTRAGSTLGRGGTDTTAVALAAALGAEYCEICSDVDGVYTADPRLAPDARRLPEVGYDEMIALARAGSKVLNQDCVEHAARHGVAIFAKATAGPRDDAGTVVRLNPAGEPRLVTAIAHRNVVNEVELPAGHDLGQLMEVLTSANALPHEVMGGGARPLHALIPTENCHRVDVLKAALAERFGASATLADARGSVTVIGPGLGEAPDIALKATGIVREALGAPPDVVLSALSLSYLVPKDKVADLVARLHAALVPLR